MKSLNGDIGTDVDDDNSTPFTLVNWTETVSFNGNLFTAVSTTTSGVTQVGNWADANEAVPARGAYRSADVVAVSTLRLQRMIDDWTRSRPVYGEFIAGTRVLVRSDMTLYVPDAEILTERFSSPRLRRSTPALPCKSTTSAPGAGRA